MSDTLAQSTTASVGPTRAGAAMPPDKGGPAGSSGQGVPVSLSRGHNSGVTLRRYSREYPNGRRQVTYLLGDGAGQGSQTCAPILAGCICPFGSLLAIVRTIDNRERSRRRAQNNIRDLVGCNGLDHLLTLTVGKNALTRSQALEMWAGYLHSKRYGRWFADYLRGRGGYVTVPESFADDNGYHLHTAIAGRLAPSLLAHLKTSWTAYLHQSHNITPPATSGGLWRINIAAPRGKADALRLGAYLGKYLGKDVGGGGRSYRAATGMRRPEQTAEVLEVTPAEMEELLDRLGYKREVRTGLGRVLGWSGWSEAEGG